MDLKSIVLVFTLLLPSFPVFGAVIELNTADEYPLSTPQSSGYEDKILSEAFRRTGNQLIIHHLPSERALTNANEGLDDGNFARIKGLERIYPNLVIVPEKITDFEFTAFTRDPGIRINGWASLKPYSVGIVTGWKILEENVVGTEHLAKVSNAEALFQMLAHDRVDVVIFDLKQGNAVIAKLGLSGIKPRRPLLARQAMFLYLNRRHADLVPPLTAVLRRMKQDGSFSAIIKQR